MRSTGVEKDGHLLTLIRICNKLAHLLEYMFPNVLRQ